MPDNDQIIEWIKSIYNILEKFIQDLKTNYVDDNYSINQKSLKGFIESKLDQMILNEKSRDSLHFRQPFFE